MGKQKNRKAYKRQNYRIKNIKNTTPTIRLLSTKKLVAWKTNVIVKYIKKNIPVEDKQDQMILVWELGLWNGTNLGNRPNPTLKQINSNSSSGILVHHFKQILTPMKIPGGGLNTRGNKIYR